MAEAKTTTDHEEIRTWAEARDGKPARVRGTRAEDDSALLRIDFPGGEQESLEQTSWDEWFETFDEKKLALLRQEETASGEESRFFKLVSRS